MYRLWGWEYDSQKPNAPKPLMVGKLTDDLVYRRLAPGVRDELRKIVPRDDKGRLKHKLHQRLTEDIGHPKLREHLASVVTLMKAFDDKEIFIRAVDRALPRFDKNLELRLD